MALLYDQPLIDPGDDLLGRAPFARGLADSVLSMDTEGGFVFALHGPWGSGKTSTLNFVLHFIKSDAERDEPLVVRFNPWWFSGRDQLIQQFFNAFRTALGGSGLRSQQARTLATNLDRFAKVLTPLTYIPAVSEPVRGIRAIFQGTSESAKALSETLSTDAYAIRRAIDGQLKEQDRTVLVVIDDLDRLPAVEIRQVFQLVKAVADFPNTLYLLAYDHELVAGALEGEQPGGGRDYLDKIVQAPFDLPAPEPTLLYKLLFAQLDRILAGAPDELFDQTAWGNLFHDGIKQLIKTPRDVKRLVNAVESSFPPVREEVAGHEFIAVQAIRVFAPTLYQQLSTGREMFPGSVDSGRGRDDPKERLRQQFDPVRDELEPDYRDAVDGLMKRLFPRWEYAYGGSMFGSSWGSSWRRAGRICSPEVFDLYFRLALPEGRLGRARFKSLIAAAEDPRELAAKLKDMAQEETPDGRTVARAFLEGVQNFTEEDVPRHLISGFIQALYIAGDELIIPSDGRGMFNLGNDMQMVRIVYQLLKRVDDEDERFEIVRQAIEGGETVELPTHEVSIWYQGLDKAEEEGRAAEELLSRPNVDRLRDLTLNKIRVAANDRTLLSLPGLSHVLYRWHEWAPGEPEEWVSAVVDSDQGFARLVEAFSGFRYSAGWTDRISKRRRVMDRDGLQQLTGSSQDELRTRAHQVLKAEPEWLTADGEEALQVLVSEEQQDSLR